MQRTLRDFWIENGEKPPIQQSRFLTGGLSGSGQHQPGVCACIFNRLLLPTQVPANHMMLSRSVIGMEAALRACLNCRSHDARVGCLVGCVILGFVPGLSLTRIFTLPGRPGPMTSSKILPATSCELRDTGVQSTT